MASQAQPYHTLPITQFVADGSMMIVDKKEVFYAGLVPFFEHCADQDIPPLDLEPRIARWQTATIDSDTIMGAIEDQVADDDHGGDPIHERAVCKEAAAAAQAVLDEAKIGAFWASDEQLYVPDGWRQMYASHVS